MEDFGIEPAGEDKRGGGRLGVLAMALSLGLAASVGAVAGTFHSPAAITD